MSSRENGNPEAYDITGSPFSRDDMKAPSWAFYGFIKYVIHNCFMKVGLGFDVHQLVKGRKLMLGGVEIPHSKGLLGHSDADVLLHALMDALLGAAGLGDIGVMFPDTDTRFKNANSLKLLDQVYKKVTEEKMFLSNLDCVIMAQKPKLRPFIPKMITQIANLLLINPQQVSIKATTTEKLGFIGREEGIAAQVVVMLQQK